MPTTPTDFEAPLPQLPTIRFLEVLNVHPRDSRLRFFASDHKYTWDGQLTLGSVTGLIHQFAQGCAILTGQECPETTKRLREDLYRKTMGGHGISGRKPYGMTTTMSELVGCKRIELNRMMRFQGEIGSNFIFKFKQLPSSNMETGIRSSGWNEWPRVSDPVVKVNKLNARDPIGGTGNGSSRDLDSTGRPLRDMCLVNSLRALGVEVRCEVSGPFRALEHGTKCCRAQGRSCYQCNTPTLEMVNTSTCVQGISQR